MNESEMLGGDDEPIPRQGRYIYRRRKRINTESSDEVIAIKKEDEKDGDEEDAWKQQPMKKRERERDRDREGMPESYEESF
ncbi:hypothetical protein RUM43_007211 [Polyplax serrata]|uniref:Uncharacterized protein n=1 Tax=Polyplax serrata TaxID=468196 RepID=A0AAN8SA51_POLSC